jgi:hypothetical protein
MKYYFDILGLNENASKEEVRAKYRVLVKKYHPDRNPDPQAALKFMQLHEAYEVLIGKRKTPRANASNARSNSTTNPTFTKEGRHNQKSHQERMKEARVRYQQALRNEVIENEKYFQRMVSGRKWLFLKLSAIIGCFLSIIILIDAFLPSNFRQEEILNHEFSKDTKANDIIIHTKSNKSFYLDLTIQEMQTILFKNPRIYIEESAILHHPISFQITTQSESSSPQITFKFWDNKELISCLFLLPTLAYFTKRKNTAYSVFYHFCLYFVSGSILFFLFTEGRLLHLLSLGWL